MGRLQVGVELGTLVPGDGSQLTVSTGRLRWPWDPEPRLPCSRTDLAFLCFGSELAPFKSSLESVVGPLHQNLPRAADIQRARQGGTRGMHWT